MNDQLVLLDEDDRNDDGTPRRSSWQLDAHTRDIGRRGVAQARQALRQAAARAA